MKENLIQQKSYDFALKIIALYQNLVKTNEFVLSKQLLRSGTSIGANVSEAQAGQSRAAYPLYIIAFMVVSPLFPKVLLQHAPVKGNSQPQNMQSLFGSITHFIKKPSRHEKHLDWNRTDGYYRTHQ